ncbi:pyridine nucleotide-disulfide oxidoreductase-domain-containing protein [Pelagophyceae sp. CCMP2097]|nr:pyridine nucleotide-disulfide oxidoreductase-domain-containing protein [Pelagophyceae sp. CCMP2097]
MAVLDWLCVGGGPCGTIAVGALLDRGSTVAWVDQRKWADMGRLGTYSSVPSNTRNDRICAAFEALNAFEFAEAQKKRAARGEATLSAANPLSTSDLALAVDALSDASAAMRKSGRLNLAEDGVQVESLDRTDGVWVAACKKGEITFEVRARHVALATGAAPRGPSAEVVNALKAAGIEVLEFDSVVAPARAAEAALSGVRFAVIGGSHSGMLAARNVLARHEDNSVLVVSNSPLKFAEERENYIKFDGTGLKGDVAAWARAPNDRLRFDIHRYNDLDLIEKLRRESISAAVFTIGFVQSRTVALAGNGQHDGRTGRLAPGLVGLGIGYPEFWTDEEGYTEPRVGFVLHFLAHCRRAIDAAEAPEAVGDNQ